MTLTSIWQIAIPAPLTQRFDYLPPEGFVGEVLPGVRVKVSFGRRAVVGIFLQVADKTDVPLCKLKQVEAVLDQEPLLSESLLRLCYWASDYYHHPIGEVLMTALPKRLREGKKITCPQKIGIFSPATQPLVLNDYQAKALFAILKANQFQCFLLAGVTGSGKTEVYLQAIAAVLARQQQALILVPEISLTPQTIARVQERFPMPIAVLHSGLTDSERSRMWCLVQQGVANIVIGTRSAVFAPLPRLGIIIVDEEHDPSFKSQSGIRYCARNLAVMRAHQENIPVVLGSATPSLETFYNAKRQRYHLLVLPKRAGDIQLPQINVIDLRKRVLKAGLSEPLIHSIEEQLVQGKQVLLFINRRGYAPVMLCPGCGYVVVCSHCDAKLTFHRNPARLICHHCEKISKPPVVCCHCHQANLITLGQGTEQIEQMVTELFPGRTVLRIDRDTTSKKNSLQEKLAQVNECAVDILIGTQMLAKGHHFVNLGLSAVIDIDSAFYSVDFRAMERMAQLLVQVAGRSGRGETLGKVIIQTYHPEHPYLPLILRGSYLLFLEALLQERQQANLPPFCYHVLIRAEALVREKPITFLKQAKNLLQAPDVETWGPMPALMERKAGKFRQHLLIQSPSRLNLQKALKSFVVALAKLANKSKVKWSIDVDPSLD